MRILTVEDEREVANLIGRKLNRSGFVADHVGSCDEARAALEEHRYSFVILDRRLPDGDGISLLPDMRRMQPGIRVLMLTACDGTDEIIAGLDAGADDYMTKPFDSDELMSRIRAGLRRAGGDRIPEIAVGNLSFDPNLRDVSINGQSIILHGRELMLLEVLLRHSGRMVSRQALIEEIYGFADDIQPSVLNLLVLRLRRRLAALEAGVEIEVARGVGYMLSKANR